MTTMTNKASFLIIIEYNNKFRQLKCLLNHPRIVLNVKDLVHLPLGSAKCFLDILN